MASEIGLAVFASAVLIVVATGSARGRRDLTNLSLLAQLRLGLVCGALGAVLASVPFADVVPDRWDAGAAAASMSATAALVARSVVHRRRRDDGAADAFRSGAVDRARR